ncbi:MAG TPA: VIT domain-containing protein, partial [Sandaracinaceae bacterium LLY-WYZ-13_1]|nr:VIT domain-containing protein [Sandaracinaceae bacterium LLY-WYZ-13_1]
MRTATVSLWLAVLAAGCGGISEDVDNTVATVTPIRGEARLGEEAAAVVARASAGQTVRSGEGALTRLVLDRGPQLLLDRDTAVALGDEGAITLESGRLFAELAAGETLELATEHGRLRGSDTAFSARIADGATRVYVVRGELAWTLGEDRGVASAGQALVLGDGAEARPATLWHDWTGGLARPGPAEAAGPQGVGMLEARVPDEVGRARWPLVVRRLDVRVRVEGDLAITEVDQLFFNPASETVEGLYRIRVPEGAVLQRFAVDRDDRLVDGYVREKAQARQAYESQVYRGSTDDPALLEWDAPGSYRARIYPIQPGETRRIVTRYAEWLRPPAGGEARLYRYPMGAAGRAPHIQEFSLAADVADAGAERVRAGMGATVDQGAVRIRRSDFRPRADFWLELVGGAGETQRAWTAPHEPPPRAPGATVPNEADERDYFYLPLVLPASLAADAEEGPLDLVVLADVSAGTDRSHLELGRSVAESLTAHLDADDRVAIVSADLTVRSVVDGEAPALGEATPERLARLLDGLARAPSGGATDLGEALAAAAALLDPERRGAVVYVGDGAPTVGELRADGLLERLARLPTPLRLYAVGVGGEANLDLLGTLTRGGGLAMRVEERAQAADAALRILAHAGRPLAHHVEVDLGTGIENAFPRRPMDAVLGEVFPVVGRVRDGLPGEVTVRGTIGGADFEETIALETQQTEESTDLRLRWAAERLRQLLLEGAGREEVAELGTRYGLITPFTSYYVPSRRELARMGGLARRWVDQPLLAVGEERTDAAAQAVLAVALGPLSIAGCTFSEDSEAAGAAAPAEPAPSSTVAPNEARNQPGQSAPAADSPAEPALETEEAEVAAAEEEVPAASAAAELDDVTVERSRRARHEAASPDVVVDGWDEDRSASAGATGGEAAGDDPMSALGALMGEREGEQTGFGGLGLRGTGRGGGDTGEGTTGLGDLGTIKHGDGG